MTTPPATPGRPTLTDLEAAANAAWDAYWAASEAAYWAYRNANAAALKAAWAAAYRAYLDADAARAARDQEQPQ